MSSVTTPKLGDQATATEVVVAPVTATAKGFNGKLIRETTFVRVGSVVTTLLYLRSVDFPSGTPGPGYPKSAVKRLEESL